MKRFAGCGYSLACLGLSLLLAGCVTQPRLGEGEIAPLNARLAGYQTDIRLVGFSPDSAGALEARIARVKKASDGSLDFLALSGGGAGGAFGAGVLRGMTLAGNRPTFEIVTGVSTGALIAPFAFLGPDWDEQLQAAFASDDAAKILKGRGIATLFSSSFFETTPLVELVDTFVTPEMIDAIADEAEKGRVLMVATSYLDVQQPVYWDLGTIARQRTHAARTLFRDVLVASASIPGVFSPVMVTVGAEGKTYQEMHVDGSATVPFFLGPELWSVTADKIKELSGANLYILVNGQLQSPARSTPLNMLSVISRAFETMMIYPARIAIGEYAALSNQQEMNMFVAYIPTDLAFAGPLDFDTSERQTLFDFARTCSSRKLIWFSAADLPVALERSRVQARNLDPAFGLPEFCPSEHPDEG